MLIPIKDGKILMSHWIQNSKYEWVKHRLRDYTPPLDVITISTGIYGPMTITFSGKNVSCLEYAYRQMYGTLSVGETEIEIIKSRIDTLLTKLDKLAIFI